MNTKITIKLNNEERSYLSEEVHALLGHFSNKAESFCVRVQGTPVWEDNRYLQWRYTNTAMAKAFDKVYYAINGRSSVKMPKEDICEEEYTYSDGETLNIVFSEPEARHLMHVLDVTLCQFDCVGSGGRQFTNPHMANAFNKVYSAISGKDHPVMKPEHFNKVLQKHIDGCVAVKLPINEFKKMFK